MTLSNPSLGLMEHFRQRAPHLQEVTLKGKVTDKNQPVAKIRVRAGGKLRVVDIRRLSVEEVEIVEPSHSCEVTVVAGREQ